MTNVITHDPFRVIGEGKMVEDESTNEDIAAALCRKYPGAEVTVSDVCSNTSEVFQPDPWYYDEGSRSWINRYTSESIPGIITERPAKELPPRGRSGRFTR